MCIFCALFYETDDIYTLYETNTCKSLHASRAQLCSPYNTGKLFSNRYQSVVRASFALVPARDSFHQIKKYLQVYKYKKKSKKRKRGRSFLFQVDLSAASSVFCITFRSRATTPGDARRVRRDSVRRTIRTNITPGECGGIISRWLCALAGDLLAAAAGDVFLCFTACFLSSAPARDTLYHLFLEVVS